MNTAPFSRSVWKSLAVKSLRLGWPAGLERAQAELSLSEMQSLLTVGVFEDVFPAVSELHQVMHEVRRLDYFALCRRDTHHGRGITPTFCKLAPEAVRAAEFQRDYLWSQAHDLGVLLPPRGLNVFWTWQALAPSDAGITREVDGAPYRGLPVAVLDAHTLEGKRRGVEVTILSGHYSQHARIAELVASAGWKALRDQVHKGRHHADRPSPRQGELDLF